MTVLKRVGFAGLALVLSGAVYGCGSQDQDHAHQDEAVHQERYVDHHVEGEAPSPDELGRETLDEDDHHHHPAPHGGKMVEVGDEFAHVELLLEDQTGELVLYILDGEGENPVRLNQKTIDLTFTSTSSGDSIALIASAVANELTGEKIGSTSEFRISSEKITNLTGLQGNIRKLEIKGFTFENVKF